MRYWNYLNCSKLACSCSFPAYLWGIEILTIHTFQSFLNIIPSLPMRYWNSKKEITFWTSQRFPAYLWGIEIIWSRECYHYQFNSQPTYEVLKFCLYYENKICLSLFPAYLWGIEIVFRQYAHSSLLHHSQPTYEVLKSVLYYILIGQPLHSQPTYEVLKL